MKQISALIKVGDSCFELMEPTGRDGPAGSFIETKGAGVHHISLLCDDVGRYARNSSQWLRILGKVLEGPSEWAFLHPKSANGVLYELTDRSSLDPSIPAIYFDGGG